MPIATAPALLVGLGARILLDAFSRTEPTVKDFILVGIWQGVALHYAMKQSGFGIMVASGIALKLFIEYSMVGDIIRCTVTVMGVVLGFLATDFLSQYFDKPPDSERRRRKTHVSTPSQELKRQRIVQFRASVEGGSVTTTPRRRGMVSDITSIDSNSEFLGSITSMSPLDREIAALRARASLADSERRRYKEERKWAISQGNLARASQMKWEVKRYTALMQKFHRDADAKVLEASVGRLHQTTTTTEPKPPSSSTRDKSIKPREQSNGGLSSTNRVSEAKTTSIRRNSTSKPVSRDAVR